MRSWGLQARLTTTLCLLVVGVLSLLGWAALRYFEKEIARTIAAHQYALVEALAAEIDDKLYLAQRGLMAMAREVPIDPGAAQAFLEYQPFAHSVFEHALALMSPDGRLLALHPGEEAMFTQDFSEREYLRETLRTARPYVSKPFVSKREYAPLILMLTAPVFDEQGRIRAVLLGSLDVTHDNFLGKLSRTRIGRTGYVYLFAADRTMIMHPDSSRIMQQDVPLGVNPLFDRAVEGFEGSGETVNSRGIHMLASYKQLIMTDWVLGASTPLEDAYAAVYQARQALLVAVAVSALVTVVLVCGCTQRLTAPLRRLTEHVRAMGEKQGEARFFQCGRGDEIGTLARAFNDLIAELDHEAEALQDSETLLAEAQSMAHMGHWQVDLPGGRSHWSEELARITGFQAQRPPPTREEFFALIHPEDLPWVRETAEEAFRSGGRFVIEHRLVRPDGEVRLVHSQAEMFRDAAGRPRRIFGTVQDVTERKQVEVQLQDLLAAMAAKNQQLEQAYQELQATQAYVRQQEKMAGIGQLAAGVAHEINNPLGYISSNLATLDKYLERLGEFVENQDALLKEGLGQAHLELESRRKALKIGAILEDIPHLLAESREGAARVKKIVQDLKSFSRVDEGEPVVADLVQVLESTINIVWNEIKYKAELVRDYAELPPLRCHPQQLGQVFMNLLVNAAQAIDKQGTIRVSARSARGWIWVDVSDTGAGIAPEHLGRLFEPFFTTKEVGKGTGLGLSIAYEIVQKHGGEIRVASQPGQGATFSVGLPQTDDVSFHDSSN
ncbi:ATP-binding protein [Geoalkalibacter halelectricus]|uniref:histidine kinase n=1 Tax=Geoalkalibacter halelectricus TaxID=2847045 RepID=A0ABY5ZNU7_9BACT|nr:ATP-binding protein [Geoalkalibacter halelectricus]MDO3377421.1 ATP-binding protein [Geoalkalibacter halelectricus]UWZ80820.1 ATP-binding protein [Geoalkalibacter halelectricus]